MAFQVDLSSAAGRREIAKLNASIDMTSAKLGSATGAAARLSAQMKKTGANPLREVVASMNSLNITMGRVIGTWGKVNAASTYTSDAMATKLKLLQREVKKLSNESKKAQVAQRGLNGSLGSGTQGAAAFRAAMYASHTHMGMFTANTLVAATAVYGLVAAIRGVIVVGGQFTQAFAATASVLDMSKESLGGLENQMLRLAEGTKFTATEVAQASTVLARTGMDANEVMQSLGPTLNLAAIGTMDMAQAADIASNVMHGFQLEASDLAKVVDVLAYTAIKSNTTVKQLGLAMSYAAPVAAATGADLNEVASMMGVMANSGIKASRAGTALRRMYVNLMKPSKEAAGVLKELGVATRDGGGEMRSMVDIMRDFTRAQGNIQDLEALSGVRALAGASAVWQDLAKEINGGTSEIQKFAAAKKEMDGQAERTREMMEDNLIDVWKKFQSAVSVKAVEGFKLIERGLMDNIKAITAFITGSESLGTSVKILSEHFKLWGEMLSGSQTEATMFALVVKDAFTAVGNVISEWLPKIVFDFPENFKAMIKVVVGELLIFGINFEAWFDKLDRRNWAFAETLKSAWTGAIGGMKLIASKGLDAVLELISAGIQKIAGIFKRFDMFSDLGKTMEGWAGSIKASATNEKELTAALKAELDLHDKKIVQFQTEERQIEAVRKAQVDAIEIAIGNDLLARDARLKLRDTRIAAIKAEAAAEREKLAEQAAQLPEGSGPRVLHTGRTALPKASDAEITAAKALNDAKETLYGEHWARMIENHSQGIEQQSALMDLENDIARAKLQTQMDTAGIMGAERRAIELELDAAHISAKESLWLSHYETMYNMETGSLQAAADFAKNIRDGDMKNALANGIKMLANEAKTNKQAFELQKALSLANAVVTLPSAVIKSFEAGGGYPWGLIPAGLMLSAGLKQIQAISSATYGGGGGSTSISGGGGGATAPSTSSALPATAGITQTKDVTITVDGFDPDSQYVLSGELVVKLMQQAANDGIPLPV